MQFFSGLKSRYESWGVKSTSITRLHLPYCLSEPVKVCETWHKNTNPVPRTSHIHFTPKQRRLQIDWFESIYCLQHCMQIHVFETKQFLSAHWVCVGREQVWLLQFKMQGRRLVMFTQTSCHESCTDAERAGWTCKNYIKQVPS